MRSMRKGEEQIQKVTGDGIRLVERAGTPLEMILVKKDPWSKDRCSDMNCPVCRGRGTSICKRRNIVYSHSCNRCKTEGKTAVYWGQTSKSLGERSHQHDKELTTRSQKSHAYQHYIECHPEALNMDMDPSQWTWAVHSSPRTCFERVVNEAVKIKLSMATRGELNLNGREEFGQYELPEVQMNGRRDWEEIEDPTCPTGTPIDPTYKRRPQDLASGPLPKRRRLEPVVSQGLHYVSTTELETHIYAKIAATEEKPTQDQELGPILMPHANTDQTDVANHPATKVKVPRLTQGLIKMFTTSSPRIKTPTSRIGTTTHVATPVTTYNPNPIDTAFAAKFAATPPKFAAKFAAKAKIGRKTPKKKPTQLSVKDLIKRFNYRPISAATDPDPCRQGDRPPFGALEKCSRSYRERGESVSPKKS